MQIKVEHGTWKIGTLTSDATIAPTNRGGWTLQITDGVRLLLSARFKTFHEAMTRWWKFYSEGE